MANFWRFHSKIDFFLIRRYMHVGIYNRFWKKVVPRVHPGSFFVYVGIVRNATISQHAFSLQPDIKWNIDGVLPAHMTGKLTESFV